MGVSITSKGRKPAGLAVQIVRLTLSIGLITAVSAGIVAVVGTSRLVSDSLAAKDMASMQLVENALLSKLAAAEIVAARAGQVIAANRKPALLGRELQASYSAAQGTARTLAVVDAEFRPLAALPATEAVLTRDARRACVAALRGNPGITRSENGSGVGTLWLAQTVLSRKGQPLVVLLEVDTGFLAETLFEGSGGGRSLFVVEGQRSLAGGSDAAVDFSKARWIGTGPGSGRVAVTDVTGRSMAGHYDQVEGLTGVDWRVVILEPESRVSTNTLDTLWPTIVVITIGGLIAIVMAWVVARRLVAPLRTLETAALRAAGGAYVRPIEASREDELGQVAKAFNAVALRLNALHDLSQLLASSSQLDQVLDGILSAMGHIVGPGVAAIYLLDESGRWLVPVRARGADITLAPAIDSTSDMWLARAMDSTEPFAFIERGRSLADELPGLVLDERGALVAPLVVGHETLGVVVVLNESDTQVSEAEFEMVRTFSAQAAVAVNNSRLFAFESESRRVAEGLRTVAEKLVRPGGLADALADVEISIAELFGANRASFALVDRTALGLAPAADRESETETLGYAMRLLGRSEGHRPILVRTGDDHAADAAMKRFGSKEMVIVPIALETDHGAVLVIALGDQRASRRDLDLADAVANEIALSLDNSYFYEQALLRANSLETVFRISQAVGSSLEVKVVLNRVLDVVQKILSADAVALMTYDARRRTVATEMARGNVSPAIVERVFKSGDDVVGYVFASGEPVAFRDLHEGMEGLSGDAARNGLHSMLAVPLLARGRSIGVLTVFSAVEGAFNDDDMSMLQTFASQAALAIDTARLYSREHEVASLLQQSILPGALPQIEGMDTASAYEPAGGDAEIGGDYYDLFRAPDGTIWMAIADVCGKGITAATKTSMIKYSVRSLVAAGFAPGRVVTEVNRMVAEGRDPNDIVTVWVGRVDPAGQTLTWSSGGHPPAMLRRARQGDVIRLAANGPLLGAVAEVTYSEETASFLPGDTVLLYTDGVTEARSGNRFFGEPRVEEALSAGGTAAEVVERLQSSVRRFVQAALRDDVAVLVVRLLDDDKGLDTSP